MLEEKDIKLIEKMISDSIASLKNTESNTDFLVERKFDTIEDKSQEDSYTHLDIYNELLGKRNGEIRNAKVIFALSGGKASKGSQTTRITLPITWVRKMGITPEHREVQIKFEDNKIIIEKKNNNI